LERPQIRFGLLKGAARGRRANLPTGSTDLAAKQFPTFLGQVLHL
jgi:hypothetical protein